MTISKMTKKKLKEQQDAWTIRGITSEAKNAAKMASKKADEFLGSWLSRKIIEAAHQDVTKKKDIAKQEDVYDILIKLSDRFDKEISTLHKSIEEVKQKPNWLKSFFSRN